MKLTPLDIHHKEFRRSLRGYDDKEVDDFLDSVADEFERLFKENIDLSERMEVANEKVRSYQAMETTLHNTLLAAQRSAEEIVATAREEAALLLRDAEVKAKEVIHDALTQKQQTTGELVRIKQAEEEFRARFKQMLDGYLASLGEVSLPDDVNLLVGKTEEGMVAEVEVAAESARAALEQAEAAAEANMAAPMAAPVADYLIPAEPESAESEAAGPEQQPAEERPPAEEQQAFSGSVERPVEADVAGDDWVTQAMPVVEEPPSSGFVTGVTLGETGPPQLPDEVELEEPREFPFGSRDALGEREDDIDIEEID